MRSMRAQARIGESGERSSWDTIARKASLARLAASASARAWRSRARACSRSRSSCFRRSEMSRAIFAPPMTRPVRSLIGDTESEMCIRRPSFRQALRLEVVDPFAPDERCEDGGLFLKPIGRQQHRDRTADGLLRRIAEDAFGALFQLMIVPLRSLLMMASSDDSTIAASISWRPTGGSSPEGTAIAPGPDGRSLAGRSFSSPVCRGRFCGMASH